MIVLQEELSEAQAPRSVTLIVFSLIDELFKLFGFVFSGRLGLFAQPFLIRIKRFHALVLEKVKPLKVPQVIVAPNRPLRGQEILRIGIQ